MGCCKDCESKAPRITRELAFDITEKETSCDMFKGKNLKLISFQFVPGSTQPNIEKQYYAKLMENGTDKANIFVYQQRLPFDELVMSIAIDRNTGNFLIRSFSIVANQFELELEADDEKPVAPKDYIDLGNGSYRVSTFIGARNLFGHLKLRQMFLDDYLNMYAAHAKGGQPVMVISSQPTAVSMTTPLHPTWKDDSLWQ